MPAFKYVARDAISGREVLNSIMAETESAAIQALVSRNLLVVAIEEKRAARPSTFGGKVRLKDLVAFTRQLATMLDAGMAMVGSLKGLAKQTRNLVMRSIITDVCTRVESGESFSDALSKHTKVFDGLYLCMVGAGEQSGTLADSLSRLASQLESSARLRRKVKSALMYPTVVTVVAIAVTIFLLAKVVPVFGEIYSSFKGKLPGPTQFLIDFSNFVKTWLILILLAMGGTVFAWVKFIRTKKGRMLWDTRRISMPIFGTLAHNICLARFTRTFASLVRSGVPIINVLQTVAKACGNVFMEKAVDTTAANIQNGMNISEALGKHAVFPELILDMISAGEQTGKLDIMLERVADHLDEEVDAALANLTSVIEPLIIVFLSLVVGTVVICMFLPIFKLSDLVNGSH